MADELRVRQGADALVRIKIPVPYDVSVAPVLKIHLPTGDVTPAFSALHAFAPFGAGGVDNVARTITLSAPLAAPTDVVGGPDGDIYVGLSGGGAFPARAINLNTEGAGDVLTLATALPRSIAKGGVVYWATFTATLTAVDVTNVAPIGAYRYTVTYSAAHAGTSAEPQRMEGLLFIDRQPWPGSGLTHHKLVERFPQVRHVPEGAVSWQPQLDMVEERLATKLVSDLGCQEGDRLVGGNRLITAAGFYFMEAYYLDGQPDTAQRYGDMAERAYNEALGSIYVDTADDGEPEQVERSGVTFAGTFTAGPTRTFRGRSR